MDNRAATHKNVRKSLIVIFANCEVIQWSYTLVFVLRFTTKPLVSLEPKSINPVENVASSPSTGQACIESFVTF